MMQYPEKTTVRMTTDMATELRTCSKEFDLSKADLVRDAIAAHLASFRQTAIPTAQHLPLQRTVPPQPQPDPPAPTVPPADSNGVRYYPDVEQRSDEWYTLRCGLVTASSVGRLLSIRHYAGQDYTCPECDAAPSNPCVSVAKRKGDDAPAPIKTLHSGRTALAAEMKDQSPLIVTPGVGDDAQNLTLALVAERITGRVEDGGFISQDMWRGQEEEPLARDAYSRLFAPVTEVGFVTREIDGATIGYSPDGLVGDDGLIEVKSRAQKKQVGTILAGQIPVENYAQLQCGLLVTGRAWGDYISYGNGMPLWKARVLPEPAWFQAITDALANFETAAADMIARYEAAIVGLPVMPRTVPTPEMVL